MNKSIKTINLIDVDKLNKMGVYIQTSKFKKRFLRIVVHNPSKRLIDKCMVSLVVRKKPSIFGILPKQYNNLNDATVTYTARLLFGKHINY